MARGSREAHRLTYATDRERRAVVGTALRAEGGAVAATARRLGVGRSTLWRWIAADEELRAMVAQRENAR